MDKDLFGNKIKMSLSRVMALVFMAAIIILIGWVVFTLSPKSFSESIAFLRVLIAVIPELPFLYLKWFFHFLLASLSLVLFVILLYFLSWIFDQIIKPFKAFFS